MATYPTVVELPFEPLGRREEIVGFGPRCTLCRQFRYLQVGDHKSRAEWKDAARKLLKAHMGRNSLSPWPAKVPLKLTVVALFESPKGRGKNAQRDFHVGRPDGDNILKMVTDCGLVGRPHGGRVNSREVTRFDELLDDATKAAARSILWADDSQIAMATVVKLVGAAGERPRVVLKIRALTADDLAEVRGW